MSVTSPGTTARCNEVLGSRDLALERPFENEFAGMERDPVALSTLEDARRRLRRELASALTDDHRRFLLGLVAGNPPWEAMRCPHLAKLPAIQWKLQNLARLKTTNAAKFQEQTDALKRVFDAIASS